MAATQQPPGPPSRFPGNLTLRREPAIDLFSRLVRDHGDAVLFHVLGRPFYLFTHPDAVREVLVSCDDHFRKGPALRKASRTLGNGLLISEGDFHRRQRRLSGPAFHPHRVATHAAAMVGFAMRTRDRWQDGQTFDLHREMMQLTLSIVAKVLFDADVEADVQKIGHAMDVTVRMFTRAMSPLSPLLDWLPTPANFRFIRARRYLWDTIGGFIQQRRGSGADQGDFLSILLNTQDAQGGGTMTDKQVRDEAMTLFTAGHETTANALAFTWYLLARHPEVQSQLHAELDAVLAGRPPGAEDLAALPYTRMVLAESMRLYPPAWAIGRQALTSCTIGGYAVPAKAVVLVCQWCTHRDARFWPEPEKFDPLRFDNEPADQRPRYAYFPFGGGSRSCIGESFAWMEATLLLATLAQQWRVEAAGDAPLALFPTITLRPARGVSLVVRRRLPPSLAGLACEPRRGPAVE